jgi:hypothetical protein
MSHPINDQILEDIANEVSSMTVDELQNAVDKYGISGQTVIDEIVENVINAKFEERSI